MDEQERPAPVQIDLDVDGDDDEVEAHVQDHSPDDGDDVEGHGLTRF
jgi:hypothetical protein